MPLPVSTRRAGQFMGSSGMALMQDDFQTQPKQFHGKVQSRLAEQYPLSLGLPAGDLQLKRSSP